MDRTTRIRLLTAASFGALAAAGLGLEALVRGLNTNEMLRYGLWRLEVGGLFVPTAAIWGYVFGNRIVLARNILLCFPFGVLVSVLTEITTVLVTVFIKGADAGAFVLVLLMLVWVGDVVVLFGIPFIIGGIGAMLIWKAFNGTSSSNRLHATQKPRA